MSTNRSGKERRALGKGLGALIPGAGVAVSSAANRDYFICPIERIHPQPDQPRQTIGKDRLRGLVDSIREQGIIQPIVVRRRDPEDGFELIAGERRWQAAQLAGLKELPVFVKEATSAEAFEMALVENIQREDLNPMEEAEALRRLIEEHGYTQAEVAARIGRDRSTVANSLRLLGLPPEVRSMVIDGSLTEGHARAILQASGKTRMTALARSAVTRGFSVREIERRARTQSVKRKTDKDAQNDTGNADLRSLVERLQRALGTRVKVIDHKGSGRLEINYKSYEELDTILSKILR
ncbi:MAG: ParB/RepB/Spo0J family partition protein [Proteobacteria bacterium]|nr:ParB/RepB/Spo0J family partition protein [Pseudomonadota bacterium]